MQRPPVGNLYDTIIFIAMAFVALALIIEWMSRKRFAVALAPFVGAFLIVLARRFEVGDAKDHLDIAAHWALFPGMAIFLTVLSINYIGDGLRDAFDPRKVM